MLGNQQLEDVLSDWNFWERAPASSVRREALSAFPKVWRKDLVWVVQGVRRSGKSTLLAQLMSDRKLDPQSCFFVNFEDPRVSDEMGYPLLDAIVALAEARALPSKERFFFFDEIQEVSGWERWLHTQTAKKKSHFVITGSNATLLGGKLGSALTGRHLSVELFPFNFEEFCVFKNAPPSSGKTQLDVFLQEGGFPGALQDEAPAQILRTLFVDIIERDVRRQVAARSVQSLVQIAKAVFDSTGSELSARKLAAHAGLAVDTVKTYLDAIEAAYLALPCQFFTYSERQRMVRPCKYYPVDLGMLSAVTTPRSDPLADRGKRLETLVFHHLRRRHRDVFYWRGKNEVDFVVNEGGALIPIQVSWDGLKPRHEIGAREFAETFKNVAPVRSITRENVEAFLRE
ncbi:MAG: ATP-binding protein [Myxococcaceae bacterium]